MTADIVIMRVDGSGTLWAAAAMGGGICQFRAIALRHSAIIIKAKINKNKRDFVGVVMVLSPYLPAA